jgi:hypothetical protein
MLKTVCVQLALAATLMISQLGSAIAHGFAGDHFFPATILTGDPFVADELVLPIVSNQQTATAPSVVETDLGVGLQKGTVKLSDVR